jgi:hypothetical protein
MGERQHGNLFWNLTLCQIPGPQGLYPRRELASLPPTTQKDRIIDGATADSTPFHGTGPEPWCGDRRARCGQRQPVRTARAHDSRHRALELLAARSLIWNEAMSRATVFLTVLSAAIIALALLADATGFGPHTITATLVLLPVVLLLGIATYVRLGTDQHRGIPARAGHEPAAEPFCSRFATRLVPATVVVFAGANRRRCGANGRQPTNDPLSRAARPSAQPRAQLRPPPAIRRARRVLRTLETLLAAGVSATTAVRALRGELPVSELVAIGRTFDRLSANVQEARQQLEMSENAADVPAEERISLAFDTFVMRTRMESYLSDGLREAGVVSGDFALLSLLAIEGQLTRAILARLVGVAPSTLGPRLNALMERGWVERRVNPGNSRSWLLTSHRLGGRATVRRFRTRSWLSTVLTAPCVTGTLTLEPSASKSSYCPPRYDRFCLTSDVALRSMIMAHDDLSRGSQIMAVTITNPSRRRSA